MADNDPTAKFLAARPYSVLSFSPNLAALYSSHTPRSERKQEWCPNCASYLLNAGSNIRVLRPRSRKGNSPKRVLRTVCRACQGTSDLAIESEKPTISVPSSAVVSSVPSPSASYTSESLPSSSHPPSVRDSSPQTQGKSKTKKKSGLQLLLLKNREKEKQERKVTTSSTNLAAFLSGL
ncbi:hypothetical protein H0H93_009513 [Arthromyces matolae]|nr:hypothetical protein H0H93_009513 [Arthromyces matolae]